MFSTFLNGLCLKNFANFHRFIQCGFSVNFGHFNADQAKKGIALKITNSFVIVVIFQVFDQYLIQTKLEFVADH